MSYADASISSVSTFFLILCEFMCSKLNFLFDVLKIDDAVLLPLALDEEFVVLLSDVLGVLYPSGPGFGCISPQVINKEMSSVNKLKVIDEEKFQFPFEWWVVVIFVLLKRPILILYVVISIISVKVRHC